MKSVTAGVIIKLLNEFNFVSCSFNGTSNFHGEQIKISHTFKKKWFSEKKVVYHRRHRRRRHHHHHQVASSWLVSIVRVIFIASIFLIFILIKQHKDSIFQFEI
jgi:hypothetical protein